jgi:hypothetical protein
MGRLATSAVLFVFLLFGSVFGAASMDPLWLYKGIPDFNDRIYGYLAPFDTCRSVNDFNPVDTSDTGDVYDGRCINLDYQFSADSFFHANLIRNPIFDSIYQIIGFDTTYDTIIRDYRPGYAGYKIDWDHGATGFKINKYKYLVFAHKGPLPNHKVIIRFGYNTVCGSPTVFQEIGTFAASTGWKLDTLTISDTLFSNIPDSTLGIINYYEMQVTINNADPADMNKSSLPGNFKVDNIMLCGHNPIDSSPKSEMVNEGGSITFRVVAHPVDSNAVLTYQWRKDGVDIAGANSASYTITSVGTANAGAYIAIVTVSNSNLSFATKAATLTVNENEKEGCGCGAGTGAALIPPLFFKAMAHRKRKKRTIKNHKV